MFDSLKTVIKVSFIVGLAGVFMVSVTNLLSFLGSIVFGGVISEVFSLISVYLPFDGSAVFGALITAITAIGSFMVASKIYDLTSSYFKV